MPELTTDELTVALAVVAGIALIAFLFALVLAVKVRKLRKGGRHPRGKRALEASQDVGDVTRRLDGMEDRLDSIVAAQQEQVALSRMAIQKFHMVRYDAFEEMGGRLSFSAALLDEHGDGIVITSINGRTETRTYAKPIKALKSEHNLSDEEREAIAGAVAGYNRGEPEASVSR